MKPKNDELYFKKKIPEGLQIERVGYNFLRRKTFGLRIK